MNGFDLGGGIYLTAEQTDFLENWPVLTEKDVEGINDIFIKYLFFGKREHGEYKCFCTSCREEFTTDDYLTHNEYTFCPKCGAECKAKSIGKSMTRQKLVEWHNIVVIHERDGELFIDAYDTCRDYKCSIKVKTDIYFVCAWHMKPGKVEGFARSYPHEIVPWVFEGRLSPSKSGFSEPFAQSSHPYYSIIGKERLQNSFAKYCQYFTKHKYDDTYSNFVKWLMIYSFYPRQLEMLVKVGAQEFVDDFIWRRRKNADIFKWDKEKPTEAFGLPKSDINEWIKSGCDLDVLRIKKLMPNKSIGECKKIERSIGVNNLKKIDALSKKLNESADTVIKYATNDKRFSGKRCSSYCGARIDIYRDYLNFAEELGYDLSVHNVKFPKNCVKEHDAAAEAVRVKTEKKQIEDMRQRTLELKRKYAFEINGLVIKVPESVDEIVDEGNKLCHCVGGYAARHAEGKVTILFLRNVSNPDTPYVTIQMGTGGNGSWGKSVNEIVQIHGYKNEQDGAERPEKIHKEFLDTWLNWLKKGSKRNEDGSPKLPKAIKTKEKVA